MGCCQSVPLDEVVLRRQGARGATDVCYPEKQTVGGLKVFTSCAVAPNTNSSTGSHGNTYTRLIVGKDWLFAALFEAVHIGGSTDATSSSPFCNAAAQYCIEHCYAEFQKAGGSSDASDVRAALESSMRSLDRRFLSDSNELPQDRLASGCTGVLLHLAFPPAPEGSASNPLASSPAATGSLDAGAAAGPVASVACVGPCGALLCRTVGGLASATSEHRVLAGGSAESHLALQDFLRSLAPSLVTSAAPPGQQRGMGRAPSRRGKSSRGKPSKAPDSVTLQQQQLQALEQEPRYSADPAAPQALGFGAAKGLGVPMTGGAGRSGGGAGEVAAPPPEPRVGLEVQTAVLALRPADECLVLLSGSAAAGLSPADAALLSHRMGGLAALPFEARPPPLRGDAAPAGGVQLDSLSAAGKWPLAPAAAAPGAVPPFNAARLLAAHAAANLAARSPAGRGAAAGMPPPCIMALGLQWPSASGAAARFADGASAIAAAGASPAAVTAAAAAAIRAQQAARYRWQMLRLFYKFHHRRHVRIIEKWHEVFDAALAAANRKARASEISAWRRAQAVVQISPAGNVKSVKSMQTDQHAASPPQQQQQQQRQASPPPQQRPSQRSPSPSPPQSQSQHSRQSLLPSRPRETQQTDPRSSGSSRPALPAHPHPHPPSPPRPRGSASASAALAHAVAATPPPPPPPHPKAAASASASALFASAGPSPPQRSFANHASTAFAAPAAAEVAASAAGATSVTPPAQLLGGSASSSRRDAAPGSAVQTRAVEASAGRGSGSGSGSGSGAVAKAHGRGEEGGEEEQVVVEKIPQSPCLFELSLRPSVDAPVGATAVEAAEATAAAAGTAVTAAEERWAVDAAATVAEAAHTTNMAARCGDAVSVSGSGPERKSSFGGPNRRLGSFGSAGSSGPGAPAAAQLSTGSVGKEGDAVMERQSSGGACASVLRAGSPCHVPGRAAPIAAQSPTISSSRNGSGTGGRGGNIGGSVGGGIVVVGGTPSRSAVQTVRSAIPALQLPRPQAAVTAAAPNPGAAAPTPGRGIPTPAATSPMPAPAPAAPQLPPPPRAGAASQNVQASAPAAASASAAGATAASVAGGLPRFTPRTSIPSRLPNPSTPSGASASGLPPPPAVSPAARPRPSFIPSPGASAVAAPGPAARISANGGSIGGGVQPGPAGRISANGGSGIGGGAFPSPSPAARVSSNGGGGSGIGGAWQAGSPSASAGAAAAGSAVRSSVSRLPRPGFTPPSKLPTAAGATPSSATGATAASLQPPVRASAFTGSEPVARSLFATSRSNSGSGAAVAAEGAAAPAAPGPRGTDAGAVCTAAAPGAKRSLPPPPPLAVPGEGALSLLQGQGQGPDKEQDVAGDEDDLLSPDAAQLAAWALEAVNVIATSPSTASASAAKSGKLEPQQEVAGAASRRPLSPRNSSEVNGSTGGASRGPSARGFSASGPGSACAAPPAKAPSGRSLADGSVPPSRTPSSSSWRFRR